MKYRYLLLFFAFALLTVHSYATSVRPLELEELVRESYQIFVGRVILVEPGTDATTGFDFTEYTFAVSDWVKGAGGATVKVRQLGHPVGKTVTGPRQFRIPGLPTYKKGEEALLFIHKPSDIGLTSPVGMRQGYYRVERDPNGEYIRAGTMMPSVIRLNARLAKSSSSPAETLPQDSIRLRDFLSLVRQIR